MADGGFFKGVFDENKNSAVGIFTTFDSKLINCKLDEGKGTVVYPDGSVTVKHYKSSGEMIFEASNRYRNKDLKTN